MAFDLDNRWDVPFNAYLCALFDAHINVEICSTVKAVKYFYKYVYKVHDRGVFEVSVPTPEEDTSNNKKRTEVDEIARFMDARYISPPEAFWHIFHFSLHRE